jgi:hypothetical protein
MKSASSKKESMKTNTISRRGGPKKERASQLGKTTGEWVRDAAGGREEPKSASISLFSQSLIVT